MAREIFRYYAICITACYNSTAEHNNSLCPSVRPSVYTLQLSKCPSKQYTQRKSNIQLSNLDLLQSKDNFNMMQTCSSSCYFLILQFLCFTVILTKVITGILYDNHVRSVYYNVDTCTSYVLQFLELSAIQRNILQTNTWFTYKLTKINSLISLLLLL